MLVSARAPTAKGKAMLRRLVDCLALACVCSLAIGVCVLLGLTLKAACRCTGQTTAAASPETGPLPDDCLVIWDWEAGVTCHIQGKCLRTGEAAPATRMLREDLAKMPCRSVLPMTPVHRDVLLRDVGTGQLHPPVGIWCWMSVDGAAGEVIGGRRIIDAVFDETAEETSGLLEKKR